MSGGRAEVVGSFGFGIGIQNGWPPGLSPLSHYIIRSCQTEFPTTQVL